MTMHEYEHQRENGPGRGDAGPGGLTDPVCGMQVNPNAPHRTHYQGREYLFCNPRCLTMFRDDPERFLGDPPAPTAAATHSSDIHTCPMHPEVRRAGPGACPKCGMALEP